MKYVEQSIILYELIDTSTEKDKKQITMTKIQYYIRCEEKEHSTAVKHWQDKNNKLRTLSANCNGD